MGTLEGITFDTTYYPVAVVSCAFFLWVFRYISPSLSAKICPTFKKLSEAKQIDWHSRYVWIICVGEKKNEYIKALLKQGLRAPGQN